MTENENVLVVVGLARSGKDELGNYLVKKYKFRKFVMSDSIKKYIKALGIKPTKQNLSKYGDLLRKEKGMDIVAKLTYREIQKSKSNKIIIIGPRSKEEIIFFKKKFPKLKIILVEANKEIRFKRRNKLDPQTKKEFFKRDKIDIKNKGLKKLIKLAHFKIKNNSTLQKFHTEIDKIVNNLKKIS
ncbi:MAG: AAA family ATPase [Candidatus Diapherotrites archaeon]|nr:AAA family ATPase [Candidatus Diapherotrites archaeon]